MHIPLLVAVLAFLAFMLLPLLDRPAGPETNAKGLRAFVSRIGRWAKE